MSTTSSESLACPVIQPGKLSRRGATAFHAFVLMSFLAASAAPTPLYRVYQQEWGFSATLLTVVFGAYALALLTALLTAGRLSDHIGRRPVIALALLLQSVAMCGFLLASGPGWLVGARLLQGAATGLATASVGAALLDLHRERGALINGISPMIGMAAGALGSTALLVHAPDPLHTVYALLLALPAGAGAAVARARDRDAPRRRLGQPASPHHRAAAGPQGAARRHARQCRGMDAGRLLPVADAVADRLGHAGPFALARRFRRDGADAERRRRHRPGRAAPGRHLPHAAVR